MPSKRDRRTACAICGTPLAYASFHCDDCVRDQGVCKACPNELTGGQVAFCGKSCNMDDGRQAKKDRGNKGNVTPVTPANDRVVALLESIDRRLANLQLSGGGGAGAQASTNTFSARDDSDMGDLAIGEKEISEKYNPAYNNVIACARIQGTLDSLPKEVYDYGVRIKKIKEEPKASGGPRKLAGADTQFAAPNFDDVDMDFEAGEQGLLQ